MNFLTRRIGSRRLQRSPDPLFRPRTPVLGEGYPGWQLKTANRTEFKRTIQPNPLGWYEESAWNYPAWKQQQAHLRDLKFKRTIQRVVPLNDYGSAQPNLPSGPIYLLESGSPDGYLLEDGSGVLLLESSSNPEDVIGSTVLKPFRTRFKRKLQLTPDPLLRTERTFSSESYPAWQATQTKWKFERKLQTTPTLYGVPQAATPEQPVTAWLTHFERTRATKRRLRTVLELPSAPLAASAAVYPSFVLERAFRTRFKRRLQRDASPYYPYLAPTLSTALVLGATFVTAQLSSRRLQTGPPVLGAFQPAAPAAAEPALILVQRSFRIRFEVRLQRVPELDSYPTTPATAEQPIAALFQRPPQRKKRKSREVEWVGLILTTLSFADLPAYALKEPFRRHQKRKLVSQPLLGSYPQTPAVAEQPPSAYALPVIFKVKATISRRDALILGDYGKAAPDYAALVLERSFRRRETQRRLLTPRQHDQWTETPPRPFSIASMNPAKFIRQRETKYRIAFSSLSFFAEYQQPPDIAGAFRTGFKPEIAYLRGAVTDIAYLQGTMADVYLVTWLNDYTAYLEGDMIDIGYFEGEM